MKEPTQTLRLKHAAETMIQLIRAPTITNCLEATHLSNDLYFSWINPTHL